MPHGKDQKAGMGALPPRYSLVLNPHAEARFTKCPRCRAQTRIRKLPLVVHVHHVDGPRLVILGKTCRLCVGCEMLIVHEADVERLIVASALGAHASRPAYFVLGTVEPRVWRRGLTGTVTLGDVREHMADFKAYMRVDFTPGGWYPKPETLANSALQPTAGKLRPGKHSSRRAGRG